MVGKRTDGSRASSEKPDEPARHTGKMTLRPDSDSDTLPTMGSGSETLPTQAQIEQLKRKNEELQQQINELRGHVSKLLGQNEEEPLTDEQEQVFARLEANKETDAKARKRAALELKKLIGQPVTKALISRLKTFLKERSWGIGTEDGHAAAPVWQNDLTRTNGGYFRLQYTDEATGKRLQPTGGGKIPEFVILERISRRKV